MSPEEDDAIQFFRERIAGSARSMPLRDARKFLKGFLLVADNENREVDGVRSAYTSLCMADDKLGQLASGDRQEQPKTPPEDGQRP